MSDLVDRIGVHRALGAPISILFAGVMVTAIVLFAEPKVSYAIRRTPRITSELSTVLNGLQGVIRGIDGVSEKVSEAIDEDADGPPPEEPEKQPVRFPGGIAAQSLAPSFAAHVLISVGAFFFFLISRHEIYELIARRRDGVAEAPIARTLEEAERLVARYFLITVIDAVLGLVVGTAFHAIGIPGPYVWGIIAALLNYILYIGPAVFAVSALLGGLLAFDGAAATLTALVYVGINGVEGNFVTPTLSVGTCRCRRFWCSCRWSSGCGCGAHWAASWRFRCCFTALRSLQGSASRSQSRSVDENARRPAVQPTSAILGQMAYHEHHEDDEDAEEPKLREALERFRYAEIADDCHDQRSYQTDHRSSHRIVPWALVRSSGQSERRRLALVPRPCRRTHERAEGPWRAKARARVGEWNLSGCQREVRENLFCTADPSCNHL